MRLRRVVTVAAVGFIALGISGTYYIASPTESHLELAPPLREWSQRSVEDVRYTKDLKSLEQSFRGQVYRSFCGPASLATVLRAYGVSKADQASVFPSVGAKLKAFYMGMSLPELAAVARSDGLVTELVYADQLNLQSFRERLKANLAREGDFVLVNYDRRVLKQKGIGHISPVAAYDEQQDAFLVLDEAAYRYPWTWVPASLLFAAVHTEADGRFRGVLFIRGYRGAG